MPFAVALVIFAFSYWFAGRKQRRQRRQTNQDEINATLTTGLPSTQTALGRRAREVADAQAAKLASPPPVHGTARWGRAEDAASLLSGNRLRAMTGSRSLRLGNLMGEEGQDTGLAIEATYPGHILTVAATGQGKSATQIVENLLTYTGSVVVVDPKGELYDLTAARRRDFGKVFRLAPYAKEGELTHHYNPLDELADPRELGSRARHLAEMLIVRQGDKGASNAAFFENEAVNLLTAILVFVVESTEPAPLRSRRTLAEVRRICTLPMLGGRAERDPQVREYLEDVFKTMAKSKNLYVQGQGKAFGGYDHKLLGSFVSEINSNLAFFDGHPGFAEVTATSDFRFANLAHDTTTIYLTVPLKKTHTSFRYLRAMIGMAFAALEEQRESREASMLFILDEFAALRDMEFMRDAVAQMRSSGAWFWFFVQDVAQLNGVYREWSNVFLSQTDHQIYFGAVSDPQTKKHISTNLGVGTFAYLDANVTWSQSVGVSDGESDNPTQIGGTSGGRNVGQSVNVSAPVMLAPKPLLTPFEVGTFLSLRRSDDSHPATSIIFSKQAGGYPLRAWRDHWTTLPGLTVQPTPQVPHKNQSNTRTAQAG